MYDLNCSATTAAYDSSGEGACCAKIAATEFPKIFPVNLSCSAVGGNGDDISYSFPDVSLFKDLSLFSAFLSALDLLSFAAFISALHLFLFFAFISA